MDEKTMLKEIGERISIRRKELNFTQDHLAGMVGTSIQMISNLENGRKAIRPSNLAKVCRALKISADYILTGTQSTAEHSELANKIAKLPPEHYRAICTIVDGLVGD